MNTNFFNLTDRKKRDILSELLLGVSPEGIIGRKELLAVNRLIRGMSSFRAPGTAKNGRVAGEKASSPGMKGAKPKTGAICCLAPEIAENVDKVYMVIRSLAPPDARLPVTRSFIVNQALSESLQEFNTRGKDSRLVRSIMQKI